MKAADLVAVVVMGLVMPAAAEELPPDDEFLEYLGGWDDAWVQSCNDPTGDEDYCEQTDELDEH